MKGWVPALLVLGVLGGLFVWAHAVRARDSRPLTLADEELAPWFPLGAHPAVLPQTFVAAYSSPMVPPQMPAGQRPVLAG